MHRERIVLVAAGTPSKKVDVARERDIPVVTVDWLRHSDRDGYLADCEKFRFEDGLDALLKGVAAGDMPVEIHAFIAGTQNAIAFQYNTLTRVSLIRLLLQSPTSEWHLFFLGKRFMVFDTPEGHKLTKAVKKVIESFGGEDVSSSLSVKSDCAVVMTNPNAPVKTHVDPYCVDPGQVVTDMWVDDVGIARRLLPLRFYHRPVPSWVYDHEGILEECVIVVTNMNGNLQKYVEMISRSVGAT